MNPSEQQEADPVVGTVIGERYRVIDALGRGGMGAVYRVEHVMMKKEMALKLLHPELGRLDEVARRFEREAEAAARLDHPNIITVTDFGRTPDGQLFLVMELLEGASLTQVIRPGGKGAPLGVQRALHIQRQILRALERAHAAGVVHRDLKPDNIMLVERDGQRDVVKLLDFGIAKITAGDEGGGEALTQAGVVFGTPEYLSPEQALGEPADGRADLYAAGVILYEMLTGQRPFESDSRVAIVSMHITQEAVPVRRRAPGENVPVVLERVVERAMQKKRDDRFPTAAAFLEALDDSSVSTTAPLPRPVQAVKNTWPFLVARAREAGVPLPRAFVGFGAVLVVALVMLIVFARRSDRPKPPPAELAGDLTRVETLLSRGELEPARAALQQLRAAHPDSARVHYLFGNLDYASGERERAVGDYQRAVKLDPGYRNDEVLRANVRALLDRRSEGPLAVALLADDIGKPALDDLIACARNCRDERVRKKAVEGAVRLGGPKLLATEGRPAGSMEDVLEKLRRGRTCKERREAALAIIDTDDRAYLDSLRAARDRHGGFLGLEEVNGCMMRELNAAIKKLEEK